MNPDIPSSVQDLIATYLDTADTEAPGLVVGLYLTGSIALGDFRPHRSDVDAVAITAAPIDEMLLAALQRVHAQLNVQMPRHPFEGIYLTWDDLTRDPAGCRPVPFAHDRQFHPAGRFELSPVTWATLARHGIVVRGPQPSTLAIWDDPAALDGWTRQNLEEYWRPWQARASGLMSRAGWSSLWPWATEWGVLGVSRLHYTLVSGEITSKYGAGLYAMRRFSARWHRIIIEALRIRRGSGGRSMYLSPFSRRADLLAYVSMAIEDGLALPPRRPHAST